MGFAPVAAAVVGTGLQVAGSLMSARQEARQESANAEAARRNAILAELDARKSEANALAELTATQEEGADWGTAAAEQIGQLIAERSASGTLMLGSNAQVVGGLRKLAARDQLRIRQEGLVRFGASMQNAQNTRLQRDNYTREISAAKDRGRQATLGGFLNAGSSLIGGSQAIQDARGV